MNHEAYRHVMEIIEQMPQKVLTQGNEKPSFQQQLADHLNHLLTEDFTGVINLLYRLDVDEKKLKSRLLQASKTAGETMAEMIIERQQQKMISRQSFTGTDNIPPEEAW